MEGKTCDPLERGVGKQAVYYSAGGEIWGLGLEERTGM